MYGDDLDTDRSPLLEQEQKKPEVPPEKLKVPLEEVAKKKKK